jgi:hypothetical protein
MREKAQRKSFPNSPQPLYRNDIVSQIELQQPSIGDITIASASVLSIMQFKSLSIASQRKPPSPYPKANAAFSKLAFFRERTSVF